MTQDEIIEMARRAQSVYGTDTWTFALCANQLEAFAHLVAAKEREACAKVCESEGIRIDASYLTCAEAIRARGEQALAQPKQDGECKYCTDGCPACDARRQSNVLP